MESCDSSQVANSITDEYDPSKMETVTVERELNSPFQNMDCDENTLIQDQMNNNCEIAQSNSSVLNPGISSASSSVNEPFSTTNDKQHASFANSSYSNPCSASSELHELWPSNDSGSPSPSINTQNFAVGVTAKNCISLSKPITHFRSTQVAFSPSLPILPMYSRNLSQEPSIQATSSHSLLFIRDITQLHSGTSINAMLHLGDDEILRNTTQCPPEEVNEPSQQNEPRRSLSLSLTSLTKKLSDVTVESDESMVIFGDTFYPKSLMEQKLRRHSYPKTNTSDIIIADHSALVAMRCCPDSEDDGSSIFEINSNHCELHLAPSESTSAGLETPSERQLPSSDESENEFDYIEEDYEALELEGMNSEIELNEPGNIDIVPEPEVAIAQVNLIQNRDAPAASAAAQLADIAISIRLLNDHIDRVMGVMNNMFPRGRQEEGEINGRVLHHGIGNSRIFPLGLANFNFGNPPRVQEVLDDSSSSSEEDFSIEAQDPPRSSKSKGKYDTGSPATNLKSLTTLGNKYDYFKVVERPRPAPGHRFVVSGFGTAAREASRQTRRLPWVPTYADRLEHMIKAYTSNQPDDQERFNRTVCFENHNDENVNEVDSPQTRNRSVSAPKLKSCLKTSREVVGEAIPKTISWSTNLQIRDLDDTVSNSDEDNSNENKVILKTQSCPGMFHDLRPYPIKLNIMHKASGPEADPMDSLSINQPIKSKNKAKKPCKCNRFSKRLNFLCCLNKKRTSENELGF